MIKNDNLFMFMFLCSTLTVIQVLHVSLGSHQRFLSLTTPVLYSVINVTVSCDTVFSKNQLNDDDSSCVNCRHGNFCFECMAL